MLIKMTCLHLYINRLLKLPDAAYLHLPLVKNKQGHKLSKQNGAIGLDIKKASQQLHAALTFLGQIIPHELRYSTPSELLQFAIKHWDNRKIPPIAGQ